MKEEVIGNTTVYEQEVTLINSGTLVKMKIGYTASVHIHLSFMNSND